MTKRTTIALNEMRERTGPILFGNDWIGCLGRAEIGVLKKHGPTSRPGRFALISEIEPVPKKLRSRLDNALGRFQRLALQISTVDSWIEDQKFPVDPRAPADRGQFNRALLSEKKRRTHSSKIKSRGPRPDKRMRVIGDMKATIESGKLSSSELQAMKEKQLVALFNANRETCRGALTAIANDKIFLRQIARRNK